MTNMFDYVAYDPQAQLLSDQLKASFVALHAQVDQLTNGREKALVLTNLEQAFMWVGKAIRNDCVKRTSEK